MANKQLADYISKALDEGKTFEDLKPPLMKLGWKEEEITATYDECIKSKITDYNIEEHYEDKKLKRRIVITFCIITALILLGIILYYLLRK